MNIYDEKILELKKNLDIKKQEQIKLVNCGWDINYNISKSMIEKNKNTWLKDDLLYKQNVLKSYKKESSTALAIAIFFGIVSFGLSFWVITNLAALFLLIPYTELAGLPLLIKIIFLVLSILAGFNLSSIFYKRYMKNSKKIKDENNLEDIEEKIKELEEREKYLEQTITENIEKRNEVKKQISEITSEINQLTANINNINKDKIKAITDIFKNEFAEEVDNKLDEYYNKQTTRNLIPNK